MLSEENSNINKFNDYKSRDNIKNLSKYISSHGPLHPYDRSFLSLIFNSLTHWWLFDIIRLGTRKTLQSYDCYRVPKSDDIEYNFDKWQNIVNKQNNGNNKSFNSFKLIWLLERKSFYVRFFIMSVATLSGLVIPQIIGELSVFYEDKSINISYGIYLSIGLLLAGLFRIELVAIVFTLAGRAVCRIRAYLCYSIYYKAINMSVSSDNANELTIGQKITLIAADTRIIAFAFGFMPMFFANVVLIIAVCIFLHIEIGISALAGWIFMIFISGPIQMLVGKKVQTATKNYITQSDYRVKFIGELIRGIKVTKMYAWERALMDEVLNYRKKEMIELLIRIKFISIMSMINIATPQFMALIMFGIYILLGYELTLKTVFAVITLIQLIRISIRILPYAIMLGVGAIVGTNRLNTFFNGTEQKDMKYIDYVNNKTSDDVDNNHLLYVVYMKDASFIWPKSKTKKGNKKQKGKQKQSGKGVELISTDNDNNSNNYEFLLDKISLSFESGKLYALIGSVGSGKSSLIQAILHEMKMIGGLFKINKHNNDGPIGYVSQTAFIINDTVRANILWGLKYNETFYNECILASSLKHDLSILANGDLTEIGERGINLSGGQKQRISFCRALYRKKLTSLYLLDDPLSAVDMNVGNNMFHNGIKKLLKNKTVLLVMNSHLHLLQYMDEILILDNGKLVCQDTYKNVINNNVYSHLLPSSDQLNNDNVHDDEKDQKQNAGKQDKIISSTLTNKKQNTKYGAIETDSDKTERAKRGKLTTKEDRKVGTVKMDVYVRYFNNAVNVFDHNNVVNDIQKGNQIKNINGFLSILLEIFILLLAQTFVSLSDILLAFWAEEEEAERFPELADQDWIIIWTTLIVLLTIVSFFASYLFGWLSNRGAQSLHMKTLYCILRAPISYFNSTPTGRILNRFSKDTNEMDSDLPMNFINFSQQGLQVIGYMVVIVISMPYALIILIFIIPGLYFLQKFFRMSSSDLKRLDQVTNTPIISQFSETLNGLDTIRAYKTKESIFLKEIRNKIRLNHKIFLTEHIGLRWFATYMDVLIILFLLCLTLLAAFLRDSFPTALLSLSVVYGYAMMGMLQWAIRSSVDVEKNFTAVERLLYFENALNKKLNKKVNKDDQKYNDIDDANQNDEGDITSEAQEINYNYRPQTEWPYSGNMIIKNLKMRYRKDLPLVLNGLNVNINNGEKIGIVGRTGAGKSSLLLTLFRLIEPENDSIITIDDINCLQLGLKDLRSNLSIIPQEPILFSGSLRFNLDPFNEKSDDEIWGVLKKCELYDLMINKDNKLLYKVSEGGTNFSAGQKQLICIARALLKRSKVLCLDEATSSIDKHTDSLIQTLIRKEFNNVTVLCIAHRLDTIIDYDKIMVLSKGNIIEYDTPNNLLNNKQGAFYKMLNSSKNSKSQNNDNDDTKSMSPIEEEEENQPQN